jgi:hypothetical protein
MVTMSIDPAALVTQVCRSWFGGSASAPWDMVRLLNEQDWRFTVSYLSAQRLSLPPTHRAALDEVTGRHKRLEELERAVQARVPSARPIKGRTLIDLYRPVLRFSRDLDVAVADADMLWALAELLTGELGFVHEAIVRLPDGELMISFVEPSADPWSPPMQVDASTVVWAGRPPAVAPLPVRAIDPAASDAVSHLLAVLASTLTRAARPRQVVDAATLLPYLSRDDCAEIARVCASVGAAPALRRLVGLVRTHAGELVDTAPILAALGAVSRTRRRKWGIGDGLAGLQHRAIFGQSRAARAAWHTRAVQRLARRRSIELWGFGLAVDPIGDSTMAERTLDTPLGTFFLAVDSELDESELARAGVQIPGSRS